MIWFYYIQFEHNLAVFRFDMIAQIIPFFLCRQICGFRIVVDIRFFYFVADTSKIMRWCCIARAATIIFGYTVNNSALLDFQGFCNDNFLPVSHIPFCRINHNKSKVFIRCKQIRIIKGILQDKEYSGVPDLLEGYFTKLNSIKWVIR